MTIQNIVFDIGNVLVVWDPEGIERGVFGNEAVDADDYVSPIRQHPTWLALNRGELTFEEAKSHYVSQGFVAEHIDRMYDDLLVSQHLKEGTVTLMRELSDSGYRLFAITDNVHEIVSYLKATYDFWDMFEAAAVSAQLGVLKPDPAIYTWLFKTAQIDPGQSLFFDDVPGNVAGAEAVGMTARIFTSPDEARKDLRSLGVGVGPAR